MGNGPERLLWERKSSLREVSWERSGRGPERELCLRERMRRWVREVREARELWRSRFSRTRRETRLWRQVTPCQVVQGSVEEFQVGSLEEEGSEVDLKDRRG